MKDIAQKIIDQELPMNVRAYFYPIIETAYDAYNNQIKNPVYNSKLFKNIKQRMLSFFVERQFEPDMLSTNFPLKSTIVKRNNFGLQGVDLMGENAIITIANVKKENSLPCTSRYKKKYAEGNSILFQQLSMIQKDNNIEVVNKPYYFIITYGGRKSLEFVKIIIPDDEVLGSLGSINLKDEIKLYNGIIIEDKQDKQKKLSKLKKEFEKQLGKEDGGQ